jgi:hypothetical protein
VTFEEALTAVKGGQRVRRKVWADFHRGLYLELVHPVLPGDPRQLMPVLAVWADGVLRPFAGANWDLLAGDWEIVPA